MSTFVCDLDGVLLNTNLAFCVAWGEILGVKLQPEDFVHWNHYLALGVDPGLGEKFWEQVWELEVYPYPGATAFVDKVKQLGYNFVILTSRTMEAAKKAMYRDIPKVSLQIDDIIAINKQKGDMKSAYINNISDAAAFLDDHTKNAVDVKMNCKHVSSVMLFDRPWNKSSDICGYVRITSYQEALAQLSQE